MSTLFPVGCILRYDRSPLATTALMRVTNVYPGHRGSIARYYGTQFYGGSVGAYHEDCREASAVDVAAWYAENKSEERR